MDIITKIQEISPSLSRVQARIAAYILDNPEKVCFSSVKDLANILNTTEVTIFRFLNKIGLNSYVDLKKELQDQVKSWLSPNERIAQAFSSIAGENQQEVLSQLIRAEQEALHQTLGSVNADSMLVAIHLMEQADSIYVVGHEISELIAKFAVFRLLQIGKPAQFLDVNNFNNVARQLSAIRDNALFLLISLPIYSAETIALADYLSDHQIAYIAVSDRHSAPIARKAAHTLVCSGDDTIFYTSIGSTISLVNLLCAMYAATTQDKTEQHQQQSQEILNALNGLFSKEIALRKPQHSQR